jgi:uncharacterized membrane protein
MKFEEFLSPDQEQHIADAIERAENGTTGEIRVHIERRCKENPLHRAINLFGELKMHETRQKNGVLIYISLLDHKLAIYGDVGIHSKVGDDFWNEDIQILVSHFKNKEFAQGIIEVVSRVGTKLAEFFPSTGDENPDELDNSVSFGD